MGNIKLEMMMMMISRRKNREDFDFDLAMERKLKYEYFGRSGSWLKKKLSEDDNIIVRHRRVII